MTDCSEAETNNERPRKKLKANSDDESYFKCYSELSIHTDMICDRVRTTAYRHAIFKNYKNIHGKVVLDIGAGTGILSVFCAQAGAKKVYAVEASSMAEHAELVVQENKLQDKIQVIHARVEDVELPEKVDVIVSEWMGYLLLYETMLPSVLHARDKWLKPGGVMLPSHASICMAAISDVEEYDGTVNFWADVNTMYNVKMSCLIPLARRNLTQRVHVKAVSGGTIVSHASQVCQLDLGSVTATELQAITGNYDVSCFGECTVHGFVFWFNVDFPGDVHLSTSPYQSESTHWQQSVVYLDQPIRAQQDTRISGKVTLSSGAQYKRFLDISLEYSIDDEEKVHTQKIVMDDFVT